MYLKPLVFRKFSAFGGKWDFHDVVWYITPVRWKFLVFYLRECQDANTNMPDIIEEITETGTKPR